MCQQFQGREMQTGRRERVGQDGMRGLTKCGVDREGGRGRGRLIRWG